MRNLLRAFVVAFGAAAVLGTTTPVQAAQLDGSLSLAGIVMSQNGGSLDVSTTINALGTIVTGAGLGDYAPVALLTNYGPHTIDLSSLTGNVINNIASFSLTSAAGSFAATSGNIVQRTASFLDIFILGTYTPAGVLAGFDPTPTSLRISINQSGQSISEAITLNSPPVPEPATMALMLIGALGVTAARRRQIGARATR